MRRRTSHPPDGPSCLALLEDWGITLRLMLLICVPIAAIIVIVALLAINLGPIGVGTLLTSGAGGGYGLKQFLVHRRRRRSRSKT